VRKIGDAGDTVVPAILAPKPFGFLVEAVTPDVFRATRDDEIYVADDPVRLLGLVKLIEVRGWQWSVTDSETDEAIKEYKLDGSGGVVERTIGPDGRAHD
jgi:hypothetical protein